ncbi:unnamed protein product [Discosporangium mesarthrocarpum]
MPTLPSLGISLKLSFRLGGAKCVTLWAPVPHHCMQCPLARSNRERSKGIVSRTGTQKTGDQDKGIDEGEDEDGIFSGVSSSSTVVREKRDTDFLLYDEGARTGGKKLSREERIFARNKAAAELATRNPPKPRGVVLVHKPSQLSGAAPGARGKKRGKRGPYRKRKGGMQANAATEAATTVLGSESSSSATDRDSVMAVSRVLSGSEAFEEAVSKALAAALTEEHAGAGGRSNTAMCPSIRDGEAGSAGPANSVAPPSGDDLRARGQDQGEEQNGVGGVVEGGKTLLPKGLAWPASSPAHVEGSSDNEIADGGSEVVLQSTAESAVVTEWAPGGGGGKGMSSAHSLPGLGRDGMSRAIPGGASHRPGVVTPKVNEGDRQSTKALPTPAPAPSNVAREELGSKTMEMDVGTETTVLEMSQEPPFPFPEPQLTVGLGNERSAENGGCAEVMFIPAGAHRTCSGTSNTAERTMTPVEEWLGRRSPE